MRFKLKFSPNIYFDKLILLKRVKEEKKVTVTWRKNVFHRFLMPKMENIEKRHFSSLQGINWLQRKATF